MESLISSAELVRRLEDVLGRIRNLGDSFIVERDGEPIARLTPLTTRSPGITMGTAIEGLRAWREVAPADPELADDLDRVNRADRPPRDPWDSFSTPAP